MNDKVILINRCNRPPQALLLNNVHWHTLIIHTFVTHPRDIENNDKENGTYDPHMPPYLVPYPIDPQVIELKKCINNLCSTPIYST